MFAGGFRDELTGITGRSIVFTCLKLMFLAQWVIRAGINRIQRDSQYALKSRNQCNQPAKSPISTWLDGVKQDASYSLTTLFLNIKVYSLS
jgi:hypothetical protein